MDPIADALIRIKNGYSVGRVSVEVKFSKLVLKLMEVLEKEGYVGKLNERSSSTSKKDRLIIVELRYESRKPSVTDIKRVSKPSLRIYKGVKDLPRVLNGLGIAVISTPKGLMTDKEARKQRLGGEVLALVW